MLVLPAGVWNIEQFCGLVVGVGVNYLFLDLIVRWDGQ